MKTKISTIFLALLLLAACKSNNNPSQITDTTTIEEGDITVYSETDWMEVIAIRDVKSEMSADLFRGSYDDALLDSLLPEGSTPSAINVFALRYGDTDYDDSPKSVVLIDAGLGAEKGGKMLSCLHYLGIRPEDVAAICLTHLHADHIGGMLSGDQPVFPNATVYLSVEEFDAWSDDGPMASQNEQWKKVLAAYALHIQPVCDGDTILDGVLVAHLASGHTPGHTVYQSSNMLFSGDLVHAEDLQIDNSQFSAKYDNDPSKAVATRKKWIDYCNTNSLMLCGAHCYTPFYQK